MFIIRNRHFVRFKNHIYYFGLTVIILSPCSKYWHSLDKGNTSTQEKRQIKKSDKNGGKNFSLNDQYCKTEDYIYCERLL